MSVAATGGGALDKILGGLKTAGAIWALDRIDRRDTKIAAAKAAGPRNYPYNGIGGLTPATQKIPMSPQTMGAYAAVVVALIAVLGFTVKIFRG